MNRLSKESYIKVIAAKKEAGDFRYDFNLDDFMETPNCYFVRHIDKDGYQLNHGYVFPRGENVERVIFNHFETGDANYKFYIGRWDDGTDKIRRAQ